MSLGALDPSAAEDRLRAPGRLLQPLEVDALRGGHPLDLGEQVVDRLVARGGHSHALPLVEQMHDQARARPGLPRARRSLDDEVALVEVEHEPLHLLEVGRLHDLAPGPRPLAREDALERRVATRALEQRAREPRERLALRLRVERPARDERARQRHLLERGPAHERQAPDGVVELEDLARLLPGRRVEDVVTGLELVLLHRVRECVHERLVPLDRLGAVGLELPDRLGVVDEVGRALTEPLEEGPPDGLRLAPVVLQELRGQVARALVVGEGVRVVGEIGEELGAQSLALRERLGRLLAHLARLLGLGPRELPPVLGLGLGPPLEQPVPEEQRREAVLLVVGADRLQELVAAGVAPLLVEEHGVRAALDLGLCGRRGRSARCPSASRSGTRRAARAGRRRRGRRGRRRGAGRRPPPRACRRGPSGA